MLTKKQISTLKRSIFGYSFPTIYFDFASNVEKDAGNMHNLETIIHNMLTSRKQQQVKYGLANIIYWGNASTGYKKYRTCQFLNNVTANQLQKFQNMVQNMVVKQKMLSLQAIKKIGMPQYSGISFISKILMFLDTKQYCVLDFHIAKLANRSGTKAIHNLKKYTKHPLPFTTHNCKIYYQWCNECQKISNQLSNQYYGNYRVVDIERGFFNLIQKGRLSDAQMIYNAA